MAKLDIFPLLEQQGKTKYWLYKQLGMSYQNFNKMVNNETTSIRYENIEAICQLLNCTPNDIIKLAQNILHDPVQVKLAVSKPAEGIHQSAYICYEPQKLRLLEHMFRLKAPKRVIIFAGSKLKVKDIAITLKRRGYNCEAMHSDLEQAQRDEVMFKFKSQQVDILIATDIVSRGIDIDDIQLVVNFDVPHDAEDYVHRIGRTARAGAEGKAVTLVGEKDQYAFRSIERFLEKEVEKNEIPEELGEAPAYTGHKEPKDKKGRSKGRSKARAKAKERPKEKATAKPKNHQKAQASSKKLPSSAASEPSDQVGGAQSAADNHPSPSVPEDGSKPAKKRRKPHHRKKSPNNKIKSAESSEEKN